MPVMIEGVNKGLLMSMRMPMTSGLQTMFDAREGVFCAYWLRSACAACVQCKEKINHLSLQRMPEPSDTQVRHQHILKAH